jgi:hypothetical protein
MQMIYRYIDIDVDVVLVCTHISRRAEVEAVLQARGTLGSAAA